MHDAAAGFERGAALDVMARALNSPHEVVCAAHLPEFSALRSCVAAQGAVTALVWRVPRLRSRFARGRSKACLAAARDWRRESSARFWEEVGEVRALLPQGSPLGLAAVHDAELSAAFVESSREHLPGAEAFFDWGGGLVWLSLDGRRPAPTPAPRWCAGR